MFCSFRKVVREGGTWFSIYRSTIIFFVDAHEKIMNISFKKQSFLNNLFISIFEIIDGKKNK